MANLFFVGGGSSTAWNATGPTNWGTASNTQDNASVPGSTDDVFFDGVGTGAANCTLTASTSIKSLDCTGYANTLTHNSSVTLTIAGSGVVYKLSAGMTYTKGSVSSSSTSFTGTSGTTLITTAGKSLGSLTFNGVGGGWRFEDNLTSTGLVTLTNGTLDTNSKTIVWGAFSSSNANVRTLTLGSSSITHTITSSTAFTIATSTNLTLNADTSTLKFNGASASGISINIGTGKTFYNMWIATTGAGNFNVAGDATFNDFRIDAGRTVNMLSGADIIVSSLSTSGTLGSLIIWQSGVVGTTWTITKTSGTVSADYLQLRDSAAGGGATYYAGDNSTNVSGNSGWTFTSPPTSAKALVGVGTMTGVGTIQ